jgi:hypothetical protein
MSTPAVLARWGQAPLRRWNAFWFTPQPAASLLAVRVVFGCTVLLWGLALAVDLDSFFLAGRVLPEPSYGPNRIGLLRFWSGDGAVLAVYTALMAAAVAVVLGKGLRLALPVVWFGITSLTLAASAVDNAGDQLLRIWAAYLAVFALLTPSRWWAGSLRRGTDRAAPAPTWALRMMQLQLSAVYIATIIDKLPGDTWRDGTAAYYALELDDFARFPVPDAVAHSLVLSNIFTWTTIGLELSLPFLLWTRRTRRFAIVAGVGLHVGFDYTMRLGFFLPAMVLGYLAFVTPGELEAVAARLERWSGRLRAEPRVEAAAHGVGGDSSGTAAPEHEAAAQQADPDEQRQGEAPDLFTAAGEQPA